MRSTRGCGRREFFDQPTVRRQEVKADIERVLPAKFTRSLASASRLAHRRTHRGPGRRYAALNEAKRPRIAHVTPIVAAGTMAANCKPLVSERRSPFSTDTEGNFAGADQTNTPICAYSSQSADRAPDRVGRMVCPRDRLPSTTRGAGIFGVWPFVHKHAPSLTTGRNDAIQPTGTGCRARTKCRQAGYGKGWRR
jgi:hypothetical protein